jgi:hypothetical protein
LEVPTIEEKVVAVEKRDTEIKEVVVYRDRIVENEKLITKDNIVNHIETQLQIEPQITEKIVPVFSTHEKIVEVPYLLEKIVEKIVIMPQVVEVIKYVHEIVEEATLGVAVGVDINVSEIRYKELYGQVRVHFETVLLELRKLRTQTPALKIQIEIIETFLVELDKLIQFPRFYQVDKERIVEKEVNHAVLVPTKDSNSIRNEVALSLLVEKLIGEIRTIKQSNPNLKLSLDEDLQLIFFSEAYGKGPIGEDLNKQLNSYKESQYNKLFSLGRTWSNDHDLIVNTILEERFSMANMVKHANLEIEKSKLLADTRLEAYRGLRQSVAVLSTKFENLERELGVIANNFQSNASVSAELSRLFTSLNGLRDALTIDAKDLRVDEQIYILGDIHGDGEGFFRLQSAFRTLERENELLREQYIRWQKEVPSTQTLISKDVIIENLSRQLSNITTELSTIKSQPTTSVNVSSNVQENEIKIRTLNSRIQELESQLRTQKVDFEGQIRAKNAQIRELEEKLAGTGKIDDSRATGVNYGQASNVDRLTSSVHSNSSNSGSQVSSNYTVGNSGVSSSVPSSTSRPYGGYNSSVPTTTTPASNVSSTASRPSGYGTTPATSNLSGSGVGGATYGNTGASYKPATSTTQGTYGTTQGSSVPASTASRPSGTYGTGSTSGTPLTASGSYGTGLTASGTGASSSSGYKPVTSATTGATGVSATSGYKPVTSNTAGSSYSSSYGTSGVTATTPVTGSSTGSYGTTGATSATGTYGAGRTSGTTGTGYTPSSYSSVTGATGVSSGASGVSGTSATSGLTSSTSRLGGSTSSTSGATGTTGTSGYTPYTSSYYNKK